MRELDNLRQITPLQILTKQVVQTCLLKSFYLVVLSSRELFAYDLNSTHHLMKLRNVSGVARVEEADEAVCVLDDGAVVSLCMEENQQLVMNPIRSASGSLQATSSLVSSRSCDLIAIVSSDTVELLRFDAQSHLRLSQSNCVLYWKQDKALPEEIPKQKGLDPSPTVDSLPCTKLQQYQHQVRNRLCLPPQPSQLQPHFASSDELSSSKKQTTSANDHFQKRYRSAAFWKCDSKLGIVLWGNGCWLDIFVGDCGAMNSRQDTSISFGVGKDSSFSLETPHDSWVTCVSNGTIDAPSRSEKNVESDFVLGFSGDGSGLLVVWRLQKSATTLRCTEFMKRKILDGTSRAITCIAQVGSMNARRKHEQLPRIWIGDSAGSAHLIMIDSIRKDLICLQVVHTGAVHELTDIVVFGANDLELPLSDDAQTKIIAYLVASASGEVWRASVGSNTKQIGLVTRTILTKNLILEHQSASIPLSPQLSMQRNRLPLWESAEEGLLSQLSPVNESGLKKDSHRSIVEVCFLQQESGTLFVAGNGSIVQVWNVLTNVLLQEIKCPDFDVTALACGSSTADPVANTSVSSSVILGGELSLLDSNDATGIEGPTLRLWIGNRNGHVHEYLVELSQCHESMMASLRGSHEFVNTSVRSVREISGGNDPKSSVVLATESAFDGGSATLNKSLSHFRSSESPPKPDTKSEVIIHSHVSDGIAGLKTQASISEALNVDILDALCDRSVGSQSSEENIQRLSSSANLVARPPRGQLTSKFTATSSSASETLKSRTSGDSSKKMRSSVTRKSLSPELPRSRSSGISRSADDSKSSNIVHDSLNGGETIVNGISLSRYPVASTLDEEASIHQHSRQTRCKSECRSRHISSMKYSPLPATTILVSSASPQLLLICYARRCIVVHDVPRHQQLRLISFENSLISLSVPLRTQLTPSNLSDSITGEDCLVVLQGAKVLKLFNATRNSISREYCFEYIDVAEIDASSRYRITNPIVGCGLIMERIGDSRTPVELEENSVHLASSRERGKRKETRMLQEIEKEQSTESLFSYHFLLVCQGNLSPDLAIYYFCGSSGSGDMNNDFVRIDLRNSTDGEESVEMAGVDWLFQGIDCACLAARTHGYALWTLRHVIVCLSTPSPDDDDVLGRRNWRTIMYGIAEISTISSNRIAYVRWLPYDHPQLSKLFVVLSDGSASTVLIDL